MRVYVAGSSREPERVRAAMAGARAAGCVIVHDWLAAIEAAGAANEGLSEVSHARGDLERLETAETLWLLLPEAPAIGAWWEAGHAHARGLTIVTSGAGRERSIFMSLAHRHYCTDDDALDAIGGLACLR